VGRQDLARVEGDDCDLLLVGDGQDAPAGVGRTDVEVVQPAGPAQGDGALAVGGRRGGDDVRAVRRPPK
jgi:hypothetical protein